MGWFLLGLAIGAVLIGPFVPTPKFVRDFYIKQGWMKADAP